MTRARVNALLGSAVLGVLVVLLGLGASNSVGWIYRDIPVTIPVDTAERVGSRSASPLDPNQSGLASTMARDVHPLSLTATIIATVVTVAVVIGMAIFVYVVLFARRRRHPARQRERDPGDSRAEADDSSLGAALAAGAQESLTRLRAGETGPAEAIIEAWRSFAAAAARHGITKPPASTSTEFTRLVLDRSRVSPEAAEELAGLYRRAMFDEWQPGGADAERAAACLARLVDELSEGSR